MEQDGLGLGLINERLAKALETAGFTAVEQYTDLDIRSAEGCPAVWSVDSVKLEDAGLRMNAGGRAAVRAEVGYRILLMGSLGDFGDRGELNDRCYEVCAELAGMRYFGNISVELGEMRADMGQKRLVRELRAVFKLYMQEI